MENLDFIVALAGQARLHVERLCSEKKDYSFAESLAGYCAIASRHLQVLLEYNGVPVDFFEGIFNGNTHLSGHCWVECHDGLILDITATQFDFPDKVFMVSRFDRRRKFYSASRKNEQALSFVETWPVMQRYSTFRYKLNLLSSIVSLEQWRLLDRKVS